MSVSAGAGTIISHGVLLVEITSERRNRKMMGKKKIVENILSEEQKREMVWIWKMWRRGLVCLSMMEIFFLTMSEMAFYSLSNFCLYFLWASLCEFLFPDYSLNTLLFLWITLVLFAIASMGTRTANRWKIQKKIR